jgi:hypothetical protein
MLTPTTGWWQPMPSHPWAGWSSGLGCREDAPWVQSATCDECGRAACISFYVSLDLVDDLSFDMDGWLAAKSEGVRRRLSDEHRADCPAAA